MCLEKMGETGHVVVLKLLIIQKNSSDFVLSQEHFKSYIKVINSEMEATASDILIFAIIDSCDKLNKMKFNEKLMDKCGRNSVCSGILGKF